MVWTIVAILMVLWALGLVNLPGLGAMVHVLLFFAIGVLGFNLMSRRGVRGAA